jgi:hypothetical protein
MMKLPKETLIEDITFRKHVNVRIKNICMYMNIITVGQARTTPDIEFRRQPNCGPKCLAEIRRVTGEYGV